MNEPSEVLTTSEVADILGVTRRRIVALIASGRMPARAIGNGERPVYVISRADVDAFEVLPRGRPKKEAAPKQKAKKKGKARDE